MAGAVSVRIEHGDMRTVLGRMVAEGQRVHSIVTDPPYHLTSIVKRFGAEDAAAAKVGQTGAYARASAGFMGKKWDGGDIAFRSGTWRLCWELLPPGGHLVAFGGTRTFHRLVCAIEEAGFEIRDTIGWLFGSGFPKSHNVSKGIDKAAGAEREVVGENPHARPTDGQTFNAMGTKTHPPLTAPATDAARQWEGWGTALKPAMELICLARKPLDGTVAANVLEHGTGALNIDGCRIGTMRNVPTSHSRSDSVIGATGISGKRLATELDPNLGRWPANICHDGSDEVVRAFPEGVNKGHAPRSGKGNPFGGINDAPRQETYFSDAGTAARFFYSAKADADDRLGSKHPTVKPVDLMRWLVRMITPPGGTCLDPFAGSGTTGMACMAEGVDCILIEREAEYVADIKRRLAHVKGEDTPLFAEALL